MLLSFHPHSTKKYRVFLDFPHLITHHICCNSDLLYPWKDWILVFWTRVISLYGIGMSSMARWLKVRFWLPKGKCIHRSDQFTSCKKKCKHELSLIGRVLCSYFTMLFVEVSLWFAFWHYNRLVLNLSYEKGNLHVSQTIWFNVDAFATCAY